MPKFHEDILNDFKVIERKYCHLNSDLGLHWTGLINEFSTSFWYDKHFSKLSKQILQSMKAIRASTRKDITSSYTERKKKRRVNFIPKFHSSLKKFVKYFTMIKKRYMYGTKVPNFIALWSTSLELLKFIGSYPPNLEIKIKLKINIGCAPLLLPLLP